MIKWNRKALQDKIYACWLGKNIGGTMGTPYEGQRDINDIQGFSSPPGAALPNDDLDLQLVWLRALDEVGPEGINSKVLGEYWMSYIGPHWNEYGIGKSNMSAGILPPMSGELNNYWKHSNGAWIRTEIWACAAPGCPEKAIRFAFEDACVDHGFGEGTFAAVFVVRDGLYPKGLERIYRGWDPHSGDCPGDRVFPKILYRIDKLRDEFDSSCYQDSQPGVCPSGRAGYDH